MTDLELLPGGHYGAAAGVNDGGVVVGVSDTADGTNHAVLWREGRITDLGTLGGFISSADAINDRGWVIGISSTADEITHAFVWKEGEMTDLGTLVRGVYQGSRAHDIDNRGRIVGSATVDNMNAVPASRPGRGLPLDRFRVLRLVARLDDDQSRRRADGSPGPGHRPAGPRLDVCSGGRHRPAGPSSRMERPRGVHLAARGIRMASRPQHRAVTSHGHQ